MKSLQEFTRKFPLFMGILMVVYIWCTVMYLPSPSGYYGSGIKELILAIVAVIIALLFVKPAFVHPTMVGVGWQFKHSIYYIIINIVLMGALSCTTLYTALSQNQVSSADILNAFVASGMICVGVGFLEEIVFRLFLFGGFVAVLGKTKKGLFWSVIISSLIFGCIHIIPSLLGSTITSSILISSILKTLQSGIVGMYFCALYCKTRNLWGLIIIHALGDFLPLFPAQAAGNGGSGDYAGGGNAQIILYAVIILLNIPVFISAIKILKSEAVPMSGPLMDDDFMPRKPED